MREIEGAGLRYLHEDGILEVRRYTFMQQLPICLLTIDNTGERNEEFS
ncbi:uncharacterized protein METZ01_LOCUS47032 [marine metagenome]|uniref:Uncharacterized protein n=1 Tax=marine metagenome TaxID=408172 RepID=A0A381RT58_9ZZZZ|nr:hypothetical protein [Acidobacteriota bacterium]